MSVRLSGTLSFFVMVVVSVVTVVGPSSLVPAQDARELYDRLREEDRSFMSNFELTVKETAGNPLIPLGLPTQRRLTITRFDGSWGVQAELLDPGIPSYQENAGELGYDHNGNLLLWRTSRFSVYAEDGEFYGSRAINTLYRIGRSGNVTATESPLSAVDLRNPATDYRNQIYSLWAAGRGFSGYLNEILTVRVTEDALIELEAIGSFRERTGKWTIALDPEASYMARRAEFRRAKRHNPILVVENAGLREFGSAVLPETGSVRFKKSSGVHDKQRYVYEFIDWKPAHNEDLLANVREQLLGPYPKDTEIYDHRKGRDVVVYNTNWADDQVLTDIENILDAMVGDEPSSPSDAIDRTEGTNEQIEDTVEKDAIPYDSVDGMLTPATILLIVSALAVGAAGVYRCVQGLRRRAR